MCACKPQQQTQDRPDNPNLLQGLLAAVATLQLSTAPFAGPALAQLDTTTKPAAEGGAAAKVEGSDLTKQSGQDALSQLQDVTLPGAEEALSKLDTSEAQSAYMELNAVSNAISELSEQAEKGINDQAIKSATSGIEQQLNAAKSMAGLD